jgi:hypothetical protein
MAGVNIRYATHGTQDLIWVVPMLGNTRPWVYIPGYLPTHPHRSLGIIALGSSYGELGICTYMGRTLM